MRRRCVISNPSGKRREMLERAVGMRLAVEPAAGIDLDLVPFGLAGQPRRRSKSSAGRSRRRSGFPAYVPPT